MSQSDAAMLVVKNAVGSNRYKIEYAFVDENIMLVCIDMGDFVSEKYLGRDACELMLAIFDQARNVPKITKVSISLLCPMRDRQGNLHSDQFCSAGCDRPTMDKLNYDYLSTKLWSSTKVVFQAFDRYDVYPGTSNIFY